MAVINRTAHRRGRLSHSGRETRELSACRVALAAVLMFAPAETVESAEMLIEALAEGRPSGVYRAALDEVRVLTQAVTETADSPLAPVS